MLCISAKRSCATKNCRPAVWVAHFADGSSAEGDVLVAADGGGSRVRRQFLPHAERIDTGNVAIAGKVFFDGGNRERIAPELCKGMTLVSGPGRV